jgi:hypothetical protein
MQVPVSMRLVAMFFAPAKPFSGKNWSRNFFCCSDKGFMVFYGFAAVVS